MTVARGDLPHRTVIKEHSWANQIVWCDIPVLDLDRAVGFYSAVLGRQVAKQEFSGITMGVLPHNDGEVGGCLVQSSAEKPSYGGVMIYLNANG